MIVNDLTWKFREGLGFLERFREFFVQCQNAQLVNKTIKRFSSRKSTKTISSLESFKNIHQNSQKIPIKIIQKVSNQNSFKTQSNPGAEMSLKIWTTQKNCLTSISLFLISCIIFHNCNFICE